MKKLFPFSLLLGILVSAPARAHFYLEPDVGFEFGSSHQDFQWTNAPESKADYNQNGTTFGAGAGYRQEFAYLGAQWERGLGGHVTDLSAVVGANFAIRYRIWIGWIVNSKDDVSSGSGFKGGLSFALSKFLRFNTEYASRSYHKYTASDAPGLTYTGDHKTFKVTLSVPYQL